MSRLIYKSGLGLFFFPYRTTNSFWIFVRIASVRRFKQISKIYVSLKYWIRGWSGGAKVLCVLHHQGDQLILAYSWTRPAIFVAGKGRGGMFFYFFCFFTLIPASLSSLSLFFIFLLSLLSLLPFSGRRHKMTHKSWRVVKPQHDQSIKILNTIFLHNLRLLPLKRRYHNSQIVITTNFIVVSSVGIRRVVCISLKILTSGFHSLLTCLKLLEKWQSVLTLNSFLVK